MNKKLRFLVVPALALVLGLAFSGCEDASGVKDNGSTKDDQKTKDPLTGTVSVTQNITMSVGVQTMVLTADVSAIDATPATFFRYQWKRGSTNIPDATAKTYTVVQADYGQPLSVEVTHLNYSDSKSGTHTVPSPKAMTLTLKWASDAYNKGGVVIEKEDGTLLKSLTNTTMANASGGVATLTYWDIDTFKMRTEHQVIETKFYFKKEDAAGSEVFDLSNGAETYTLSNTDGGLGGVLNNVFAKKQN